MSRTSLHRPRRHRAVWDRRVTDTRLLPKSSLLTLSPGIPLPGDGRPKDYMRHTLSKGLCRIGAPLTGRSRFALGEYKEPPDPGLRAIVPYSDSTPVTPGLPRPVNHGLESMQPSPGAVERYCGTDRPHSETPSNLARLLRHVWGFRRIAADLLGVGAGVVVFLFKSRGPSIASHPHPQQTKPQIESTPSPRSLFIPRLREESGAGHSPPWGWAALPVADPPRREPGRRVGAGRCLHPTPTHERGRLPAHTPIYSSSPASSPQEGSRNFPADQSHRHELSIVTIKKPSNHGKPTVRNTGAPTR